MFFVLTKKQKHFDMMDIQINTNREEFHKIFEEGFIILEILLKKLPSKQHLYKNPFKIRSV